MTTLSAMSAEAPRCGTLLTYDLGVNKTVKKNSFVTGRSLGEYIQYLFEGFSTSLKNLKPTDHWIDLGAGKGYAAEEYIKSFGTAQSAANVTLITYKLDRWFGISKHQGKLDVLDGRLLENIPKGEIKKAKLMTDVFGVISYTRDLSRALDIIFDRLETGGELYVYSSNTHTLIKTADEVITLTQFLSTIPGLKVEGKWGTIRITKLAEEIEVPQLRLIRMNEETVPPSRTFEFLFP